MVYQKICSTKTQIYKKPAINWKTHTNRFKNYDSVVKDTKVLLYKWEISTKHKSTRQRFAKKYFDDVDGDRRL